MWFTAHSFQQPSQSRMRSMIEILSIILHRLCAELSPRGFHPWSKCDVVVVNPPFPLDLLLSHLLGVINLAVEYLLSNLLLDLKVLHDLVGLSLIQQVLQLLFSLQRMQGHASCIMYLLQPLLSLLYFWFQHEVGVLAWHELLAFHFFYSALRNRRNNQPRWFSISVLSVDIQVLSVCFYLRRERIVALFCQGLLVTADEVVHLVESSVVFQWLHLMTPLAQVLVACVVSQGLGVDVEMLSLVLYAASSSHASLGCERRLCCPMLTFCCNWGSIILQVVLKCRWECDRRVDVVSSLLHYGLSTSPLACRELLSEAFVDCSLLWNQDCIFIKLPFEFTLWLHFCVWSHIVIQGLVGHLFAFGIDFEYTQLFIVVHVLNRLLSSDSAQSLVGFFVCRFSWGNWISGSDVNRERKVLLTKNLLSVLQSKVFSVTDEILLDFYHLMQRHLGLDWL